jgi:hypothetical protein
MLKDIEQYPEMALEYVPGRGLHSQEHSDSLAKHLSELQYVYPQPRSLGNGVAHAWFATGGWLYAPFKKQHNAYQAMAFPEWLRSMGTRFVLNSALCKGHSGWNTCLVSYGKHTSWTHGEDPWVHDGDLSAEMWMFPEGSQVQLTISKGAIRFALVPLPGSFVVWRGAGWTIEAVSETPVYRLAFRVASRVSFHKQYSAKIANRFARALAVEQRIVPAHADTPAPPVQVAPVPAEAALPVEAAVVNVVTVSTVDKRKKRKVAPPPPPRK